MKKRFSNRYLYRELMLIVLTGCIYSIASAQSLDQSYYFKLPAAVPSSPTVASMEKFGNIPVNYSTGATSVDVPIWTIKCGELSYPISISYHSAGVKVQEKSSVVGIGWALIGEGVISRTVAGKPDEESTDEPNYSSVTSADWDYIYRVGEDVADSELDVYSYNFNGKSGKFLIKQDGSIFMIPYANLKITLNASGFTVVDETGITYTFNKKETTLATRPVGFINYVSSWRLTQVQTSDKQQSINFEYNTSKSNSQDFTSYVQSIGQEPGRTCATVGTLVPVFTAPVATISGTTTTFSELARIVFPNGSIDFTYTGDRTDLIGSANGRLTSIEIKNDPQKKLLKKFSLSQTYFASGGKMKLDSIKESQPGLVSARRYSFEYNNLPMVYPESLAQDYWGFYNGAGNNGSLIQTETVQYPNNLNQLITYNIGSAVRTTDSSAMKANMLTAVNWPTGGRTEFTFDVHRYSLEDYLISTVNYNTVAVGMYQTGTTNFTYPATGAFNPKIIVDFSMYEFADVTARPYVQLKNLTTNQIVFTMLNEDRFNPNHYEFPATMVPGNNYELKAFVFSNITTNPVLMAKIAVAYSYSTGAIGTGYGGGLRVRQVKNFTKPGQLASTDYYEYGIGTTLTPYRFINTRHREIRHIYWLSENNCVTSCYVYSSWFARTYNSGSIFPISTVAGSPIMYSMVTKYQLDASGNAKGKSVYEYDIVQDQPLPLSSSPNYPSLVLNSWQNGALLRETSYLRSGSSYQVVRSIENGYDIMKTSVAYSLAVKEKWIRWGCHYGISNLTVDDHFFYDQAPIYTGIKKLKRSTETQVDANGNSNSIVTTYEYNGATHDYPTKISKIDSKGFRISILNKYPVDFAAAGNVYQKMINANITSPVIESKQIKEVLNNLGVVTSSETLSTVKNNYRDWKNNTLVLAPETIQGSIYNEALENKIVFADYNDQKRPIELKKESDNTISYLYDYNYQYPIAQATNAKVTDIAYTSFEADGEGNWTFSGVPTIDGTAPTGKKSYSSSSSISKSGLNSAMSYTVSYWKKSGTLTINGTAGTAGRTINGWTFYSHKITNPVSGNITLSLSSAVIDELRLYPAVASLMKTYTYDPIVGVTSESDANDRIIYYEYDDMQRLQLIRDQDRNVLKKVCYNYSGQAESCSIFYNVAKSGNFTRNNCTSCLAGSTVTYSIPANTYSATSQVAADQMAQDDVNANGQNYANTNGSCSTPPNAGFMATNNALSQLTVTFTNLCSGVVYTHYLNGSASSNMGPVPKGSYNVFMSVSGSHAYRINSLTQTGTFGVNFINVSIDGVGSIQVD